MPIKNDVFFSAASCKKTSFLVNNFGQFYFVRALVNFESGATNQCLIYMFSTFVLMFVANTCSLK